MDTLANHTKMEPLFRHLRLNLSPRRLNRWPQQFPLRRLHPLLPFNQLHPLPFKPLRLRHLQLLKQ
jgi:hypothetical protein